MEAAPAPPPPPPATPPPPPPPPPVPPPPTPPPPSRHCDGHQPSRRYCCCCDPGCPSRLPIGSNCCSAVGRWIAPKPHDPTRKTNWRKDSCTTIAPRRSWKNCRDASYHTLPGSRR